VIVLTKVFRKSVFWLGALSVALVLVYLFIGSSQIYNLLAYCNFPLFALLHVLPLSILPMDLLMFGRSYTQVESFMIDLPYCITYIVSFIGYGFLADFIFNKLEKRKTKEMNPSGSLDKNRLKLGIALIAVSKILFIFFVYLATRWNSDLFEGVIVIIGFWPMMIMFLKGIRLVIKE